MRHQSDLESNKPSRLIRNYVRPDQHILSQACCDLRERMRVHRLFVTRARLGHLDSLLSRVRHTGVMQRCNSSLQFGIANSAPLPLGAVFGTGSTPRVWRIADKRQQRQVISSAATVTRKSSQREPRKENVEGDFYVDHTCIGEGLQQEPVWICAAAYLAIWCIT